jgi:hypothetical protein
MNFTYAIILSIIIFNSCCGLKVFEEAVLEGNISIVLAYGT